MIDIELPRAGELVLIYTRRFLFTHAIWNGKTFVDMRGNIWLPEEILDWDYDDDLQIISPSTAE